jgi:lipid-A-disaccharide synthase
MWLGRALVNIRKFFGVAKLAEDYFAQHKPDAVVLIDYPGFHWHLAKRAKAAGIPCYYFVPPQLWAWAGWRVKKVKRYFTAVLTALPFEEDWYRSRGVRTHYVGHPYFDDIAAQVLDDAFLAAETAKPGPVVALLPGSRNQEVEHNAELMLRAARKILIAQPSARFLVAAFNEPQAQRVRALTATTPLPIEVHVGRTPEIIARCDAAIAVSGSVSLELLARRKPAVIVYRIGKTARWLSRRFMTCDHICLVNLLAAETLYPEFLTTRDDSVDIAKHVLYWLNHTSARQDVKHKLDTLCHRVAVPGACMRAAEFLTVQHGIKRSFSVAVLS